MHDKKMLGLIQSFIDQAVYQEGRSTTEHVLAVNTGVKRPLTPSFQEPARKSAEEIFKMNKDMKGCMT